MRRGKTTSTLRSTDLAVTGPRRRSVRIIRSPDRAAVGRGLELDGTTWLIGRDGEGAGRIEDEHLSREHARLAPRGPAGGYVIEELKARNGVFLNGVRLARPTTVLPNHVISLGETLLVVDQEPDHDLLPAAADADPSLASECVGSSLGAVRLRRALATTATSSGNVLLLGPTGAGKEVAARAIHRLGPRSEGPWVPVNCAAITPELAEDYFFGHKRGSFSGADKDRTGYFAQASGGTLFLDEVGDLPLPLQAKLLRVLEDGSMRPIGASADQQVDVRIVAATLKDLELTDFRRDLYARLADWVLHVPPLVQRRADILELWRHFTAADGPGASTHAFDEALLLYAWPMNVRELQKLARRLVTLARGAERFELGLLPEVMQAPLRMRAAGGAPVDADAGRELAAAASTAEARPEPGQAPTTEELVEALVAARGNVAAAARAKGWHKTQVYRWITRYGLEVADYR